MLDIIHCGICLSFIYELLWINIISIPKPKRFLPYPAYAIHDSTVSDVVLSFLHKAFFSKILLVLSWHLSFF